MQKNREFPLSGVIGIVANSIDELDAAIAKKLQCVEIRADLLLDGGLSTDELMQAIQQAKNGGVAVLFTLRHPTHGGKFTGTEDQRASISRLALNAGADLIDLEWDSDAATLFQEFLQEHPNEHPKNENSRLILSYHDFNGMPDEPELQLLTNKMCAGNPAAIKIVPTAESLHDAVRMLHWVSQAGDSTIRRIGFAMGPQGACSRVLTLAYGAPVTYASFGKAVAPGQVEMDALLKTYRSAELTRNTELVAVVNAAVDKPHSISELNESFATSNIDKVAIAFTGVSVDELRSQSEHLRIVEILS